MYSFGFGSWRMLHVPSSCKLPFSLRCAFPIKRTPTTTTECENVFVRQTHSSACLAASHPGIYHNTYQSFTFILHHSSPGIKRARCANAFFDAVISMAILCNKTGVLFYFCVSFKWYLQRAEAGRSESVGATGHCWLPSPLPLPLLMLRRKSRKYKKWHALKSHRMMQNIYIFVLQIRPHPGIV